MIGRKKTVVLSAVFFVFLFAISMIPVTAIKTPAVNSNIQTNNSLEDKAVTITIGTTSGKFTGVDDINYYILEVTPGIWNITLETGNVSMGLFGGGVNLYQQKTVYSTYLDENFTIWDNYQTFFIGANNVASFRYEATFPQGIAVTTPGKLMLRLDPHSVSYDRLIDPWHYKIYVSHQAPTAISNGNVNIEMDGNQAKAYAFTVTNSDFYNFTYLANDTYNGFVFSETGDKYANFVGDEFSIFYLETGITYYYFVYSGSNPLELELYLTRVTPEETITGTGSVIIDFAATEFYKGISWQGSPEGVYQITADAPPTMDLALFLMSYSSDVGIEADFPSILGDENLTLFIRTLETEDWWQPIGNDNSHFESFIAYSPSNDGYYGGDVYNCFSNEHLDICLFNYAGSGSVNLTVTQLPIETISFDTPSTVTINETFSETAFKVLEFESEPNYEYNVSLAPDVNSYDGGVAIGESWYVGTLDSNPFISMIGNGDINFTTYNEVFGGKRGSADSIISYLILAIDTPGSPNWGRVTVTVEEIAPTEISVNEEVTKTFTKTDEFTMYKVELGKDNSYTIDLQMNQNSRGYSYLVLYNEKSQKPDVDAQIDFSLSFELFGEPTLGAVVSYYLFKNTITLASNEDQTVYLLVAGDQDVTISIIVSEVEEGFGVGGIALALLILLIPLAFIAGVLMYKNYPELFSRGTS